MGGAETGQCQGITLTADAIVEKALRGMTADQKKSFWRKHGDLDLMRRNAEHWAIVTAEGVVEARAQEEAAAALAQQLHAALPDAPSVSRPRL